MQIDPAHIAHIDTVTPDTVIPDGSILLPTGEIIAARVEIEGFVFLWDSEAGGYVFA